VSCAQFLPYSLMKAFGVYAAQAVETLIFYSRSMSSAVILLKALPATLTNSNCFFMLVDIPSKKHASSLWIYSLKVTPRHLPIFWICMSVYPARESAFTPPPTPERVCIKPSDWNSFCCWVFKSCSSTFDGFAYIFVGDIQLFAPFLKISGEESF
jgi:hypothetical protein